MDNQQPGPSGTKRTKSQPENEALPAGYKLCEACYYAIKIEQFGVHVQSQHSLTYAPNPEFDGNKKENLSARTKQTARRNAPGTSQTATQAGTRPTKALATKAARKSAPSSSRGKNYFFSDTQLYNLEMAARKKAENAAKRAEEAAKKATKVAEKAKKKK